jgi:hypothetical protein
MSVYGGPDIVTDGLVFCVDPANSKSYSGSGTKLNDLSLYSSNMDLVNGVAVTNGSCVFDGVDDHTTTTAGQAFYQYTTEITACSWFKRNGNITGGSGGGQCTKDVDNWTTSNVWLFHGNGSPTNSITFYVNGGSYYRNRDTGFLADNTWYFICGTCSSSLIKIYVNGVQVGISATGMNSGNIISNSNSVIQYGKDPRYSTGRFFTGSVGSSYVYNRELSSSEILNNYNALKGRFGL